MDTTRRLTNDEMRELFLSPMTSTAETNAAIALRFEVTRARRREDALHLALRNLLAALAEDGEKALSEAIYCASKEAE